MTSFFPQNFILPECKPEWNREAITVFSRLPSLRRLQATPLLQPSLFQSQCSMSEMMRIFLIFFIKKCPLSITFFAIYIFGQLQLLCSFLWCLAYISSQSMYNNFFLEDWFLAINKYDFVYLPWKLNNPYCHSYRCSGKIPKKELAIFCD